ncbi:MAG: triosephosphate isomerase (TIM) [Parcubacteria group bacterium LiPW_39]|nr:MAG: triosephosphate isomerase (TIM) [Parcubacteria group bacterium LiPW_39]
MSKPLIVANWKMNPKTAKEALALFEAVKKGIGGSKNLRVVICPPFCWLPKLKPIAALRLGGQNCHWEVSGSFTGEISAAMLADSGAQYVILGHSERRQYLGETDEIINLKIKAALKASLKPILCVGEKEGEEMGSVVERQLTGALAGLGVNQTREVIIAYEPVWAIGTGRACLSDDALSAALFIRRLITKLYSRFLADKISLLYGGSVNVQNAANYITQAGMNGLLVGGASLEAEEFVKIIKNVNLKM